MAIRRTTAREFQKRFQRLDEPVLVNDGIFFPQVTAELLKIAERVKSDDAGSSKKRS